MDVREKLRQRAIPAEGKNHARRTQDVARHKSERGNGRSGQKNGATQVAEKPRRRFGEWCVRVICQIGTERPLRNELDQKVDDRRNDKREIAERGTVRAGFFTSPLGINATSIPTKAKIKSMTSSPNDLLPGQPLQLRFGG